MSAASSGFLVCIGQVHVCRPCFQLVRSRDVSSMACRTRHRLSPSCLTANKFVRSRPAQGIEKQGTKALHQNARDDSSGAESLNKPLIVLIGWLGAKERHFSKYVELWQQMGHLTFGYRPTTPSIMLPPLGSAKATDFIKDVQVFIRDNADRPVIYHIFSNAGFLFFGTVMRAIAAADLQSSQHRPQAAQSLQKSMLQPVQGLILDSAPCRLSPDISARGFTAAVLSKPAKSIRQQHPGLVSAVQMLFTPILRFPPIANRQDQIWRAWESTAPNSPQLYLYSSADALIPPSEVEKFQKQQQQRGVQVHSKMWTDSAHCEHYRVHPEEYAEQLKHFVDLCGSQRVPSGKL